MRTIRTAWERQTQEARLEAFFSLMPMAIAATWLSSLGLYWLFSSYAARGSALGWLGFSSLSSLLWLIMIQRDARIRNKSRRHPLLGHRLMACITSAIFGTALAFLFPRLQGYGQLLIALFYLAFLSSGAFVTAMVPSISLAWISTLSLAAVIALVLDRDGLLIPSLAGFFLFVAYIGLVALAYFRLYTERFVFQMEAETREKELATLLEQSPLSIVLTDLEGKIIQTNRKMEELSGYTRQELIGQNPRILQSGKTPEGMYKELWESLAKGDSWTGQFMNRDRQGRDYIERASISPIRDGDGVVRRYMAIKEDVTLQREYEARLARQNEIIELLLRDFEDKSGDWLWELDGDLRISYISTKMMANRSGTSILGLKAWDFLRAGLPPEDLEAEDLLAELQAAIDAGRPFEDLEAKILVEGAIHWLAFTAAPLGPGPEGRHGWRGVGRDITDKKLLELALGRRADFDELTGLPTRYRFRAILDEEMATGGGKAILGIMKLGKLDLIRSGLGSRTCDTLITTFIGEFRENIGKEVILARLERDEFAFWAPRPDIYQLERIHAFSGRMNDPLQVGPDSFQVDLSMGLAFYPEDALDGSNLFHAADLALEGARTSPARKVMRYQIGLATDFALRLALVNEFPTALANGQFHMLYQPQVDGRTGRPVAAEALMRWDHPRRGAISPAEFIPLAERSGFITALGEWSLTQVCADAMKWEEAVKVSVNVSGVQLRDPRRLRQAVIRALEASGMAPERLILEITESAMFRDGDEVVANALAGFRKMGIAIALDDFGTGYSSLAYIHRLHLDKIKIDQSFVRSLGTDRDSGKIIALILGLARSMGLETVAEGVETEGQADFLRKAGCTWFQGYLFGKPMGQEAFRSLLSPDPGTAPAASLD